MTVAPAQPPFQLAPSPSLHTAALPEPLSRRLSPALRPFSSQRHEQHCKPRRLSTASTSRRRPSLCSPAGLQPNPPPFFGKDRAPTNVVSRVMALLRVEDRP
ncbi:hypothetical protein J5N97_026149 [Dioscorea zingiberensis]|uniref:Uncharacterized protein n=1 Tax=Dioscorea zingiberensis TaxID=325984 RepID=A0A9D5H6F5_9LILI|nr:hypothetical protein J5N97_026149 [Dioscorea zingiberensis]